MEELELVTYDSGAAFLASCNDFLMEREIANNLPLGIAPRLTSVDLMFSVHDSTTKKGIESVDWHDTLAFLIT